VASRRSRDRPSWPAALRHVTSLLSRPQILVPSARPVVSSLFPRPSENRVEYAPCVCVQHAKSLEQCTVSAAVAARQSVNFYRLADRNRCRANLSIATEKRHFSRLAYIYIRSGRPRSFSFFGASRRVDRRVTRPDPSPAFAFVHRISCNAR